MAPFKKIFTSSLFKLSSLNLVNILTRIITGFFASKILAVFIGPGGMAITGSFRNFLTSLDAFSTLGIQNGIIKYTAQHDANREELKRVLSTIFITVGVAVLVCMFILIIPAGFISSAVFNGNKSFAWLFRLLGCVLPFYTGSLLFISVLNGLGRYKRVIFLNVAINITGVCLSAILIWQYGVNGALAGLIISPVLLFVMSFYPLYKIVGNFNFVQKKYFSTDILKGLSSYSFMMLFSAVTAPYVYISLRNMIIDNSGEAEAGYWEAVNRLSVFYLMFATTLLTVYFLPQLSKSSSVSQTKNIFRNYYKIMVPVFGFGLILVYLLRLVIIKIIFTAEFDNMQKLFAWQLAGDFFKVCSLILGNEFFAKKMTKSYLATELMSLTVLYTAGNILIPFFGSEGAVMAHFVTYVIYFFVLFFVFRKKLT